MKTRSLWVALVLASLAAVVGCTIVTPAEP